MTEVYYPEASDDRQGVLESYFETMRQFIVSQEAVMSAYLGTAPVSRRRVVPTRSFAGTPASRPILAQPAPQTPPPYATQPQPAPVAATPAPQTAPAAPPAAAAQPAEAPVPEPKPAAPAPATPQPAAPAPVTPKPAVPAPATPQPAAPAPAPGDAPY